MKVMSNGRPRYLGNFYLRVYPLEGSLFSITEELIIQWIQEFQIHAQDATQWKDKVPKVSDNETEYVDDQFDDLLKSSEIWFPFMKNGTE